MEPRQTLSTITSKCLTGMDGVLEQAKPDLVLVHGDTSTTFAGALAAFYLSLIHISGGPHPVPAASGSGGATTAGRPLRVRMGDVWSLPEGLKILIRAYPQFPHLIFPASHVWVAFLDVYKRQDQLCV